MKLYPEKKTSSLSSIETHNFLKNISLVMYRPSSEIRQ